MIYNTNHYHLNQLLINRTETGVPQIPQLLNVNLRS